MHAPPFLHILSPSSPIFILPPLLVLSVSLSSTPSYSSRKASCSPASSCRPLFFSCFQAVPLTELAFPSLTAFHLYFGGAGFEPRLETPSLTGRASWFSSLLPYIFRTPSLDQTTNISFHIPSKSLPINHTIIKRKIFREIKTINRHEVTP